MRISGRKGRAEIRNASIDRSVRDWIVSFVSLGGAAYCVGSAALGSRLSILRTFSLVVVRMDRELSCLYERATAARRDGPRPASASDVPR